MRLTLLFTLSFLLTGALAQERRSILDDPDFLKDLEDPQQIGSPPCVSCESAMAEAAEIVPFLRDRRTNTSFPRNTSVDGASCVDRITTIQNSGDQGVPSGVRICQNSGRFSRTLHFRADDGSRDGAFMYFNEEATQSDWQNMKTALVMLPRRSIPNVRLVGRELHLTLSTGELVVLDAVTKAHLRGPLRFGPVSTTPRATPYTYTGGAIVISATHNAIMPFELGRTPAEQAQQRTATVLVRQQGQECRVRRSALFNDGGTTLHVDDAAVVRAINANCTPRPARPFSL